MDGRGHVRLHGLSARTCCNTADGERGVEPEADLGDRVGELLLHELLRGERRAKLRALQRVPPRHVDARLVARAPAGRRALPPAQRAL